MNYRLQISLVLLFGLAMSACAGYTNRGNEDHLRFMEESQRNHQIFMEQSLRDHHSF